MNEEEMKKFFEEAENKYGEEVVKGMMDGILDLICASGDKRAKVLKTYKEIKTMIQEQIEYNLMPHLDNKDKVDEFYNLIIAIKEQTKQLIQDFKEKNI